ncbi:putative shk1 kinase-binding protein 1 [Kockovaella imperatae]|uniref:Putative shk1 kinase-binding protein 1 n=1 Tax=Kockovaella imperatae TaxID=4999 RepID=A0A1Y1U9S7_9TREE|nr:putative shk1 kinase-binding protein 1 [Kockovaella imperatae]ORX34266.1 putative shk1 kinase-binding protein 1 [Kockovaella imperatae]
MPRHPIALSLSAPYPALPTQAGPTPSPLLELITSTLGNSDYDQICLPLTNGKWQERWERLCLRPMDEDEASVIAAGGSNGAAAARAREALDKEADIWRKEGGLRRDEVVISRLEETQHVIALASEWLELDSMDEGIRFDSELALRSEMAYALYLAVPTLVIPAPSLANRSQLPAYARAIAGLLQMGGTTAFTQISIRIPISDPTELINHGPNPGSTSTSPSANLFSPSNSSQAEQLNNSHKRLSSLSTRPSSIIGHGSLGITPGSISGMAVSASGARIPSASSAMSGVSSSLSIKSTTTVAPGASGDPSSTWEMWECIRRMCGYNNRLTVTLDLTNPLPPSAGALARWISEPVKQVWLPASSFIPNAKGYPVLSKACQAFLRGISKLGPTYILANTQPTKHQSGGPNAYLQYVRHVTSTAGPANANSGTAAAANIPDSGPSEFTVGYGDFLQAPLQPLKDDLGSATYEIFERDPVKYRQYEEAIYLALSDLPQSSTHVVTVVGAGRGPLVTCVLSALQRSGRKARVYAVEKNLSALVTLEERKALEWRDAVQVIRGDMRSVAVPEPADIIVSELLGSFGDNELSPECLDGALRFLKPQGISIPISYTAHLAPVSSSRLHSEVLAAKSPGASETPYVVMMQAVNVLSGDGGGASGRCGDRIQQCWLFEHPRRDLVLNADGTPLTNSHNTRSANLLFHIPFAGNLHGLAGYFEAHLYSNIGLSIHPENAHRVSPDMFSWFPLFFPFKEPLYLPSGSELEVGIWRLWDGLKDKVWYEWSAESYLPLIGSGGPTPSSASGQPSERLINGQRITSTGGPSTPNLGSGTIASPMMDAPFSPGTNQNGSRDAGSSAMMRVKIGQTSLHNAGGVHSWVGL